MSCCLQRSVAQMVANRIDGRPDASEPEQESLVSDGGCEPEESEEREKGGVREEREALRLDPLGMCSSIGIGPLVNGPVGCPQIPGFPFESVRLPATTERGSEEPRDEKMEKRSDEPRDEKMVGGERLGDPSPKSSGGEGDRLGTGGREGCEEGVIRETTILINRRGQFTSSSDSKSQSSEICKIGCTRSSEAQRQQHAQGPAKDSGAGHSKDSCREIYCKKTSVQTYIPSCNSLGNSMHLDSRCSPHNTNTCNVSLHTSYISEKPADSSTLTRVALARRGDGVSRPRRGADSIKVVT